MERAKLSDVESFVAELVDGAVTGILAVTAALVRLEKALKDSAKQLGAKTWRTLVQVGAAGADAKQAGTVLLTAWLQGKRISTRTPPPRAQPQQAEVRGDGDESDTDSASSDEDGDDAPEPRWEHRRGREAAASSGPVSYTHVTLPTSVTV